MGNNRLISADEPLDSDSRLVDLAWRQIATIEAIHPTAGSSIAAGALRTHPLPADSFSGYRLLREIHRGGQGIVYEAIQESTNRTVAIKVLKQGPFAGDAELARFEREVHILGRLKHPNIVAIHDRGLSAGHAYLVMDYVTGRTLDQYLADADCPIETKLLLFVKICEAVHAAHLRGIIHRDLKPANIRIDGSGEPQVLDFGLAKVADDEGDASPEQAVTMTGQFVGSMPWSSPEQAMGRAHDIDLRTDVYSLGVILYQLLTGVFPYVATGPARAVQDRILNSEPIRPSTVVTNLDSDLETIVLKCLAKEPERRYQSAGDLARDIRHYLADEPISATPPSARYRIRKFAQRNRAVVMAGMAIALTLVIASVVSISFGISEARQRRDAERSRERAETAERLTLERADQLEQVVKFQSAQLSGVDARTMGLRFRTDLLRKAREAAQRSKPSPEELNSRIEGLEQLIAGSDFTSVALSSLEENFFQPALAAIDAEFQDQPLVKARLLQTSASTLLSVGLIDSAMEPQTEALEIRRRLLGEDHVDTLASMSAMGTLLRTRGKVPEADAYYHDVLDKRRRVLGEEHPDTLDSINNMARLRWDQGKLDEAEQLYREALEKRRRILGEEHVDTIATIGKTGGLLRNRGKLPEAEALCREALEKSRRVLGDEHRSTLVAIGNMASFYRAQGKLAESETLYREALEKSRRVLGEGHRDTLIVAGNLAAVLMESGKLSEAEEALRESLAQRRRVLGNLHPDTLNAITNMAGVLWKQQKLSDAEPYFKEALEATRAVLGDGHSDTLTAVNNMGVALRAQGKLAEAEPYLREAMEKSRRVSGEQHSDTLISTLNLGGLLLAMDKPRDAIDLLVPAEAPARRAFTGDNALQLARLLGALGRARTAISEFDTAQRNLTEAEGIFSKARGASSRDRTEVVTGLAELFEAWHAAEPDKGYDAKAAEWRARLSNATP